MSDATQLILASLLTVTHGSDLSVVPEAARRLAEQLSARHGDVHVSSETSGWHLYMIRLNLAEISQTRRQVFESLRAQGIGVNVHYIPVHTQPFYQKLGFKPGDFPKAEQYYREAISIPMHVNLSDTDMVFVANSLREAMGL